MDENRKVLDMELMSYYDTKVKAWALNEIAKSTEEVTELVKNCNIWELDEGNYTVKSVIKCSLDTDNYIMLGGLNTKAKVTKKDNYNYYMVLDEKDTGSLILAFGFVECATGVGQRTIFDFGNILSDITTLKNDVVIKSGSITSTELADNSIITGKIDDKAVTLDKLADNVVNTFDVKGSADAAANTALASAKEYADGKFSWGSF